MERVATRYVELRFVGGGPLDGERSVVRASHFSIGQVILLEVLGRFGRRHVYSTVESWPGERAVVLQYQGPWARADCAR